MKKVAIRTLYGEFNMGNKLQNYATLFNINKLNYEVETLRYKSKTKKTFVGKTKFYIKELAKKILYIVPNSTKWNKKYRKYEKSREEIFKKFSKEYLNISEYEFTYDKINDKKVNDFDFTVVGSDQVWNDFNLNSDDIKFFLCENTNTKNIALSASFGVNSIKSENTDIYINGLQNFSNISVRELAGAKIVDNLIGYKPIVLADPTITLSAQEWDVVSNKPLWDVPEKYVLCYILGDDIYIKEVEKYAKKNNLEVINLLDSTKEYYRSGPSEFLYLIKNAQIVCTDSFHGSVFSLVYNTPLKIFQRVDYNKDMSSRISTLVDKFECEEALYENEIIIEDFDWEKINNNIYFEKNKYINFLKESLNNGEIK